MPQTAEWHEDASQKFVGRLGVILSQADVPTAVRQAIAVARRFAAERTWQLRGQQRTKPEVVQQMTSRKTEALRKHINHHHRRLRLASVVSVPPQKPFSTGGVSNDVLTHWNQLADYFVAAHEKHAVFLESKALALATSEQVARNAQKFVGCEGQQLVDLEAGWRKSLDIDERTSHALLEAWAAIVAAQERVQMAVSSGLLQRLSMSSTVQEQDAAGLSCGSMQIVAEKAHKIGVRAVDRALWPLLEQLLVLEQLAKYQRQELTAKKLPGVEPMPLGPVLDSLYEVAKESADPQALGGRLIAARALDVLGATICPAPAGCTGMWLRNATIPGRIWTAQRPGAVMLQGASVATEVEACILGANGRASSLLGTDARVANEGAEVEVLTAIAKLQQREMRLLQVISEMKKNLTDEKLQQTQRPSLLEAIGSGAGQGVFAHNARPEHCFGKGCADDLVINLTVSAESSICRFLMHLR